MRAWTGPSEPEQGCEPDGEARQAPPTWRTASSTPGMKLTRSKESWRIVSVSPCEPKTTSWWATRPGRRTECTCRPPSTEPASCAGH